MTVESTASAAAFAAFAESATLAGASVSVMVDRAVDVVDSEGNIRHAAALVHFLASALPAWSAGDLLVTASGNYKLRQKVIDDGFVVKIEATPVS